MRSMGTSIVKRDQRSRLYVLRRRKFLVFKDIEKKRIFSHLVLVKLYPTGKLIVIRTAGYMPIKNLIVAILVGNRPNCHNGVWR